MLLPSKELAMLAKRVDICLPGKTAPKGFDIRYRQFYWLLEYDAQGELVAACRLADRLGKFTKHGLSLPQAFVAIVDEGLAASPSLEQLERDYVAQRGSTAAFDALRKKLEAIDGVGQMRVAKFLGNVAAKTDDEALSRARGLFVEADACSHQVINHAAFAKLRTGIEGFLAAHPGHAACGDLVEQLVGTALKYTFDVKAKCQSLADALSARTDSQGGHQLAKLLLDRCATITARDEKKLQGMKSKAYGRLRLTARLGKADATLEGLDATKTFGVMRPIHAEWRQEATAKMQPRSRGN